MKDRTCGCCEGTEPLTPLPTANRPGLDALSYRVGTHATFFETMVARLSIHRLEDGRRPLQQLTTRDPEDPSLALLDAWATVAATVTGCHAIFPLLTLYIYPLHILLLSHT